MRRSLAVFMLFLGLGLAVSSCGKGSDGLTVWQADLLGANENPPRAVAGTGTAGITFDGTTLTFRVEVHGLQNVRLAHIHSGIASANGPVRVDFFLGPTIATVDGLLAEGTLTAANVRGISFDALIAEMKAGNAYVNVHTDEFPAGAIRGQTRMLQ